jgi:hypothetical protein
VILIPFCHSSGTTVGLAWPSQLCVAEATSQPGGILFCTFISLFFFLIHATSVGGEQFVTGAAVSSVAKDEWKVVAHEVCFTYQSEHHIFPNNVSSDWTQFRSPS